MGVQLCPCRLYLQMQARCMCSASCIHAATGVIRAYIFISPNTSLAAVSGLMSRLLLFHHEMLEHHAFGHAVGCLMVGKSLEQCVGIGQGGSRTFSSSDVAVYGA